MGAGAHAATNFIESAGAGLGADYSLKRVAGVSGCSLLFYNKLAFFFQFSQTIIITHDHGLGVNLQSCHG